MKLTGVAVLAILAAGCAISSQERVRPPTQAIPSLQGSYHHVRPKETLWGIAHSYGLDVRMLASVNRLPSAGQLKAGQQLYIPLPSESKAFLWPIRGSLRPPSSRRSIQIAAAPGTLVRATRRGRVAVATQELSGWGKTVVVDHLDGYVSIYAGLEQILVAPGMELRQGMPLGSLGADDLHFEIRYGAVPRNTLALLPRG